MGGALGTALGNVRLGAAGMANPSGFLAAWALMTNAVLQARKVDA